MKMIVDERQPHAKSVTVLCSGPVLDLVSPIKAPCPFVPTQTIGSKAESVSLWPVCADCFRARLVAIANTGATPMIGDLHSFLEYVRVARARGAA